MAGIGFQLRQLAREDSISSIVASAGHAAMIAAGPWLFTILALGGITLATEQVAGLATLADFRAIVIYAFAVSLVFSSPITIVSTRLIGDTLWSKQPEHVRGLLLASYVAVLPPVAFAAIATALAFRLRLDPAIALVSLTVIVSFIWVALTFCGAVRDYRGVTVSFLVGLAVALVGAVAMALMGGRSTSMAFAFAAGLTATFIGLTSRVFATFPHPVTDPEIGLRLIARGLRKYWRISVGALIGATAVWIDKWVFWLSPIGEAVDVGLLHAPIYDSTMFIASLAIIPALASFVVKLETGFFERYQQYFATIGTHGTLDQIEVARRRMASYTMDSLALITITLIAIAGILMLTAPIIVEALGLQFRQIAILRYGALGSVFQFVFIASVSLLLFFDRRRTYLAAQVLYLALNAGLSMLSLWLGEDYYGTGFFAAALISAVVAFRLADLTFERLNFLTFIGNNPSVRAASNVRPTGIEAFLTRVFGP